MESRRTLRCDVALVSSCTRFHFETRKLSWQLAKAALATVWQKPISPLGIWELQAAKLQSAQRGRLCLCRASKHHDGKLPIPNLPNILSVFVLCPMLVKSCCWGILFKEVLWEEEQPAENVRNAMHKQGEPYSHQFIAQMESGRLKVFGSGRQTYSRKNI